MSDDVTDDKGDKKTESEPVAVAVAVDSWLQQTQAAFFLDHGCGFGYGYASIGDFKTSVFSVGLRQNGWVWIEPNGGK